MQLHAGRSDAHEFPNGKIFNGKRSNTPSAPLPLLLIIMACLLKRRFVAGSFMDFRFRRSKIPPVFVNNLKAPGFKFAGTRTLPGPVPGRRGAANKKSCHGTRGGRGSRQLRVGRSESLSRSFKFTPAPWHAAHRTALRLA